LKEIIILRISGALIVMAAMDCSSRYIRDVCEGMQKEIKVNIPQRIPPQHAPPSTFFRSDDRAGASEAR
jgi:hypothetical protein